MKPFITEAQLALFKYQAGGKYFNCPMSYIAQQEFVEFSKINRSIKFNIIEYFDFFYHRKLNEEVWEIVFDDDSSLLIREYYKNDKKFFEFKVGNSDRIYNLSSIFSD